MNHDIAPASPGRSCGRALLIVAAVLLVLLFRRPDAFLNPQFWAEDFLFLLDGEKTGVATLWMPQAGYLQFIPRLIAWPAAFLDPALQPGFFVAGWLFVALTVVFSCLSPRLDLPLKPWLAAAVLLVPHSGEVFLNPTNAQWVAALGILLTVLKTDPARPGEWLADGGMLFCAGLSGPFIIFALPLFAVRAAQRKSTASWVLFGLAAGLSAAEAWFILHAPPDREFVGPFSPFTLVVNVCFRLPCNVFFGTLATGAMGGPAAIALGLAVLGFLGFAVYRGGRRRAVMASLLGFIFILLAFTTLRKRFDLWAFGDIANGDRYFFIPKVVLLWIAGIVFATQPNRWIKWTAFTLMVCSLASNAPRFKFQPYIDYHWYARCPDIRAGRPVEVMINPGWKFAYRRGQQ